MRTSIPNQLANGLIGGFFAMLAMFFGGLFLAYAPGVAGSIGFAIGLAAFTFMLKGGGLIGFAAFGIGEI